MQVIVGGMGQLGFRVACLLRALGHDVSVITTDPREAFLGEARRRGVRIVMGDARGRDNLIEAGIETAEALIACTDNDLVNVEVALDAHALNPRLRIVVRLFDQDLADAMENQFGITHALAISVIAAPAFAAAAMGERVRGAFDHEGKRFVVRSGEDPSVVSAHDYQSVASVKSKSVSRAKAFLKSINPLNALKTVGKIWKSAPTAIKNIAWTILFLSVVSVFVFSMAMGLSPINSIYYVVTTLTTTGYGDITPLLQPVWVKIYACILMVLGSAAVATLYSLLTDFVVAARIDAIRGATKTNKEDHVVVVGLGNVGFRTALELQMLGEEVVIIDRDPAPNLRSFVRGGEFLTGDGRSADTLHKAAIESARVIMAVTDDDAVNLSVALNAKKINPSIHAVVRLFDADFARKVEGVLGIDSALSASRISAPIFVGSVLDPSAQFHFVHDGAFYSVHRENGEFEYRRHVLSKSIP